MDQDILSRVVEVLRRSTGRGSGFGVNADLVLTAAHVVGDDDEVLIVADVDELRGFVVWRDTQLDAALVRLPTPRWNAGVTRWAAISGINRVSCTAIGYPSVQKIADGTRVEEHIAGFIMPATSRRIGRYAINVESALPYELKPRESPWAGMSGAAVLTEDGQHILAIITEDPAGFQTSRLEAVPVSALLEVPEFARLVGADDTSLTTISDTDASDATLNTVFADPVAATDMRQLGVHPSVRDNAGHSDQPLYVGRDKDHLLDDLFRSASDRGGFAILVGRSSVGKTRMAYEAALRNASTWSIYLPGSTAELTDVADRVPPRTVVWLDEIEQFIADGLEPGTIRRMLRRPQVVVLGTLWPAIYHRWIRIATDSPRDDTHRRERAVLSLAQVIPLEPALSDGERLRAAALVTSEPRFKEALTSEYGFTQAIAAAPALVERWEAADNAFARGLITAAIDLRSVSGLRLIPHDMLRMAVKDYVSATEWEAAPEDWFEQALMYGTERLKGAAAALVTHIVDGQALTRVADYLQQYGVGKYPEPVPQSAWDALVEFARDGEALYSAAMAASSRALRKIEVRLLLRSREYRDSPETEYELFVLLLRSGHVEKALEARDRLFAMGPSDPLRRLLGDAIAEARGKQPFLFEQKEYLGTDDDGVVWAVKSSVSMAPELEPETPELDMEQRYTALGNSYAMLGRLADAGDRDALAMMVTTSEDEDTLRDRFIQRGLEAGLTEAMIARANAATAAGDRAEAVRWWENAAQAGAADAAHQLATIALSDGDDERAEIYLRLAFKLNNFSATLELINLLERQGRPAELERLLVNLVDIKFPSAWRKLVVYLFASGRTNDARRLLENVDRGRFDEIEYVVGDLRDRGYNDLADEARPSWDLAVRYARNGDGPAMQAVYKTLLADERTDDQKQIGELWLRRSLKQGGSGNVRDYVDLLADRGHSPEEIENWLRLAVVRGILPAFGILLKLILDKPDQEDAIALVVNGLTTEGKTATELLDD